MKNDVEIIPSEMVGASEMDPDSPESISIVETYINDVKYDIEEIEIQSKIQQVQIPSTEGQNTQEHIEIDSQPMDNSKEIVDNSIDTNVQNSSQKNFIV
jgi:hypothetical protein